MYTGLQKNMKLQKRPVKLHVSFFLPTEFYPFADFDHINCGVQNGHYYSTRVFNPLNTTAASAACGVGVYSLLSREAR